VERNGRSRPGGSHAGASHPSTLARFFRCCLREFNLFAPSRDSQGPRDPTWILGLLFALWLAVVLLTLLRHELWRDEYQVLAFARVASSVRDLLWRIRFEGHPFLFYLVNYVGFHIFHSRLVLPASSLLFAAASVLLFLFRSPFHLYIKILFTFSVLPLYEYSVMQRNYGISMMLFFLLAVVHSSRLRGRFYLLLLLLILLANTNLHSMLLSPFLLLVFLGEAWREAGRRAVLTAAALVALAAIVYSGWKTVPPSTSVILRPEMLSPSALLESFRESALHPFDRFNRIFPVLRPLFPLVLLGLSSWWLSRASRLLAVLPWLALILLDVFFGTVYTGLLRHQGIYFIFLLVLLWLARDRARPPRRIPGVPLALTLALVLAGQVWGSVLKIRGDLGLPMSSNAAFGSRHRADPDLPGIVLLPEPDYALVSLQYYVQAPTFFVREGRFGVVPAFSETNRRDLSLARLLRAADSLRVAGGVERKVLIVLGHRQVVSEPEGSTGFSYGEHFSWSKEARARLLAGSRPYASYWGAVTDENYDVYEWLGP